jgi:hypothetical protein
VRVQVPTAQSVALVWAREQEQEQEQEQERQQEPQ